MLKVKMVDGDFKTITQLLQLCETQFFETTGDQHHLHSRMLNTLRIKNKIKWNTKQIEKIKWETKQIKIR